MNQQLTCGLEIVADKLRKVNTCDTMTQKIVLRCYYSK